MRVLSYGRSMTRPGLSSLNVAGPVFGYTTRTVGNVGDPSLKPYQSNDADLSFEWYFGKGGVLALGAFNKDIVTSLKTSVVSKFVPAEYLPAIYADPQYIAVANPTLDPALVPYTFTIPVNSDDGNSVKGYEFTYNQPFTFLSGWLSNFGVATNYTHVSAKDSTGLSPNSYNLTAYYDSPKFGARVSLNKRDDYLLSEPGGNGHVQERKYGPRHIDFEAFYNLNDKLTFSLTGINVTDEIERIYGTGQWRSGFDPGILAYGCPVVSGCAIPPVSRTASAAVAFARTGDFLGIDGGAAGTGLHRRQLHSLAALRRIQRPISAD